MPHNDTADPLVERVTALTAILEAVEVIAMEKAREDERWRAQSLSIAVRYFHEGDYTGALVHARRSQLTTSST